MINNRMRKKTMINHRVKHLLFVGIALTVCVLLLSLAGCASSFEGNSIKNADSYALDIETMNGTDSHTLELERGDTLQIQFEAEKGSLYIEITAPDGTAIYQGDGTEATKFTLDVPVDGAYTISVEGKKAQGSIYIDMEKAPELTSEELVGPWHLDQSKNDLASFADSPDLFPSYGEWVPAWKFAETVK